MVSAGVLALHGIAAVIVFVARKKKAGVGEGFLAVGLFGILFSVGWTILTMITKLLLPPEGFAEWFNRDAVTLVALTIMEGALYLALKPERSGEKKDSTSA